MADDRLGDDRGSLSALDLTYLYEAKVEMITDHAVKRISGTEVEIVNIYAPSRSRRLKADTIVMATARSSENAMYHLLRERGRSVEAIGCAIAPRTVYEATLEGHRADRKLGRAGAQPHGARGVAEPSLGVTSLGTTGSGVTVADMTRRGGAVRARPSFASCAPIPPRLRPSQRPAQRPRPRTR